MTTIDETTASDLVWGADAIAKVIGRSERATFHLLSSGLLPAKKIGGKWVGSREKILNALTGAE
jgi:hypothetical protein